MAHLVPRKLPWRWREAGLRLALGIGMALPTYGFPAISSPAVTISPVDSWTYADLADVFLAAPIVVVARIREAIALKDAGNSSPRPGTIRTYISAEVDTLIRGTGGVAPQIAWIADLPLDARGKMPKVKKTRVILAALPVTGRPAEIRLAAPDAMLPWSAALQDRIRAIVASGLTADAPSRIAGVAGAFHSAGTLTGEGETQIFLVTADRQPVSLSVLRRPGQEPSWALALGEIVDEAARPPERDTLGWYRLACSLPASLPTSATADLETGDAEAARRDYDFVLASLGPCTRLRR